MVGIVRHRQTKGSATDRSHLNHRATPRLHKLGYRDQLGRLARLTGLEVESTLRPIETPLQKFSFCYALD